MSWRDNLQPASFRGIPFFIESHEIEGGRRSVQHEYVQRDKPFAEDTGRKGRSFSFEAYVIGTDYFPSRNALMEALEKEGAGELVHPYFGRVSVQAKPFRVRESTRDGGMAIFSLSFFEAGESEFPSSLIDNRRVVKDKVDELFDSVNSEFEKVFSVLNKPEFVKQSAVNKVNEIAGKINEVTAKVVKTQQGIAGVNQKIEDLQNRVGALINTPRELAATIQGALRGLHDAITGGPRTQLEAMEQFFPYGNADKKVPPYTETREQEQDNLDMLNRLTQLSSLGNASEAATEISFESSDDAKGVRENLVENFENQMELTGDDTVFQNIQDLKTEVIRGVPPPEEQLPTIGKLRLNEPRPALVVAYELYESTELEADLIARNEITHPGFMPSNKDLEVLQIE